MSTPTAHLTFTTVDGEARELFIVEHSINPQDLAKVCIPSSTDANVAFFALNSPASKKTSIKKACNAARMTFLASNQRLWEWVSGVQATTFNDRCDHTVRLSFETRSGVSRELVIVEHSIDPSHIHDLCQRQDPNIPVALRALNSRRHMRVPIQKACERARVNFLPNANEFWSWVTGLQATSHSGQPVTPPQKPTPRPTQRHRRQGAMDQYYKLRFCASWETSPERDNAIAQAKRDLGTSLSDEKLNALISQGEEVRRRVNLIKNQLRKNGSRQQVIQAAVAQLHDESWGVSPQDEKMCRKLFQKQVNKEIKNYKNRVKQRAATKKYGSTSKVLKTEHSHRIDQLAPSKEWTLLIDETGNAFGPEQQGGLLGKWVGLLKPKEVTLPPITQFHATTEVDPRRVEDTFKAVLERPLGIFGLQARSAPQTTFHDPWQIGILELIEWTLRLLPRDETTQTQLDVKVEQRAEHVAQDSWKPAVAEMQRQLANTGLLHNIELNIDVVGKDFEDMGYVDVIAYTWGSTKKLSESRLNQSGLKHVCLLEDDLEPLSECLDALLDGHAPRLHMWNALLQQADKYEHVSDAFVHEVLARLQKAVEDQKQVRDDLLSYIYDHLDNKQIDVRQLDRQLRFMESCSVDLRLYPTELLHWEIGRYSNQNHLGFFDPIGEQNIMKHCEELFDEDARLCCMAVLTQATMKTNAFLFSEARALISPWLQYPTALVGLNYAGRLHSLHGQLYAFEGQYEQAISCFEEALKLFDRLTNPHEKALERAQTSTYLAIAQMDYVGQSTVGQHLSGYFNMSIKEAIQHLANDESAANKYKHHTLVRYLYFYGTEEERSHYIHQLEEQYQTGFGHPWGLILLYQALLLKEFNRPYKKRLKQSLTTTYDEEIPTGPTMQLILAVILTICIRHEYNRDLSQELIKVLFDTLPTTFPNAQQALTHLGNHETFSSDRELIKATLPFNFR